MGCGDWRCGRRDAAHGGEWEACAGLSWPGNRDLGFGRSPAEPGLGEFPPRILHGCQRLWDLFPADESLKACAPSRQRTRAGQHGTALQGSPGESIVNHDCSLHAISRASGSTALPEKQPLPFPARASQYVLISSFRNSKHTGT